MNIITTTALSNFRKNKSRNILIGVAIGLTALLLTVVPTVAFGLIDVQFRAVEKVYPTFHGMYRNVEYDVVQEMLEDDRFEEIGLREDAAYVYCEEDSDIMMPMLACDQTAIYLNRQKLLEGRFPEAKDEIVVSHGFLDVMGLSGDVGDTVEVPFQPVTSGGKGMMQTQTFTITGFVEDTEQGIKRGIYSVYVASEFAEMLQGNEERMFRVYFRMSGAEGKITDDIEAEMKEIAKDYGMKESDVVENGTYLMATYIDPSFYTGIALVVLVVVIAGILTIYSIYYVSMLNKVQEYGRLRAIGATKRQIRKLVFREGFAVYVLAVPVGIVLGAAMGIFIISAMIHDAPGTLDNVMLQSMEQVWTEKEVTLIKWQVILLAALVSFVTVYLSLLRPMQIAGKISAIEAIRFQDENKAKKKLRTGYEEISTRKLMAVNLGRNKKRTIITICSLGATGILFMVIATVLSCMNPKVMADDAVRGEISIGVDSWEGDEMHPEHALKNIQKDNPLTEEFQKQIETIDGVEKIEIVTYARVELLEVKEDDGRPYQGGISGISDEALKEIEPYLEEGSLSDPALSDGTGIIIDSVYEKLYPEVKQGLGDTFHVRIEDGDTMHEKELKIVAVVRAPGSLIPGWMNMRSNVLQSLCQADLSGRMNIWVEENKTKTVTEEIRNLVEQQEFLEMTTWQEVYDEGENVIGYTMYGCYGMLFVFGLIGILNLINTMINSVHIRRKEIGVIQAIGMSGRQTNRMLQMEGLFYTAGTLIVSLGIGSVAGYGVFLWARANSIMSVKFYHYPVFPAAVLVVAVLVVQFLVVYLIHKNLKKQSLIERIRI